MVYKNFMYGFMMHGKGTHFLRIIKVCDSFFSINIPFLTDFSSFRLLIFMVFIEQTLTARLCSGVILFF